MSRGSGGSGAQRVVLVGPCPPPHGGISVHLVTAQAALRRAGVRCRMLDSGGHRARGGVWSAVRSLAGLLLRIDAHARRGYLLHLHTNGHGVASWTIALLGASAAWRAPGRVLTLHSGLFPQFAERAPFPARLLARATANRYHRIVCVNQRVCDALASLGVARDRMTVLPAHLLTPAAATALPESVDGWLASRSPLLSSALFFRPEYGVEVLLEALARLAVEHPGLGCVVMGDGDAEAMAAARRRIAELGLDQRVLLTGDVPHAICVATMARSDVFLRPAIVDGDAISVREALALGVPVVASDASERPQGVILHRSGDAADLAAQIAAALAAQIAAALAARVAAALGAEPSASVAARSGGEHGGPDTLLWIYRGLRRPEGAALATPRARLARRLARLREMSGEEVRHRLRQSLRAAVDRVTKGAPYERSDSALLSDWVGHATSAGAEPFLRHLREVVAPRFYLPASGDDRRAVAELLWRRFPSWLSAAAADAERLCEHRVEILGWGEVALGADIDWHRDPVSGEVWPKRHFASYDTVRFGARDAKRVWELNRHQHLPRLGKAYLLLGEERYAREVVAQMLRWIDQNPPRTGVHWHSSLEIAIRCLSWLWALFYVLPSPALDEASARRICRSLLAQLDHVARYLSVWSSPNTHLLGEATALYVGGLLFGDRPRGRRWLELGRGLLEREAERQVLPDGMHAELSPYYHCYAVDFYLQGLALARRSSQSLAAPTRARVEAMLEALAHFAAVDGSIPLLGDDDGGRALALAATTHYRDVSDLLCAGAVLFGRGDWKRQASTLREEAFWLIGPAGWAAWEALPPVQPATRRRTFERAGYVLERSDWTPTGAQLVFDRGGLGELGGGHGHADALSITLRAHGARLLVDSGTAVYNGAPEWRAFFRSTRAHNTMSIDGLDQSTPADTFRWKDRAAARPVGDGDHEVIRFTAGEHDGYAGALGLVHRRRVLSIDAGYWLVLDDVRAADTPAGAPRRAEASGRHRYELFWHFAPEAEVTIDRSGASGSLAAVARVAGAGLHLRLLASAPLDGRVVSGASAPLQGWVSSRYGEKQAAPVLEARFHARAPASCVTLLAASGEGRRSSIAGASSAVPVRVLDSGAWLGAAPIAFAIPHLRGEDLLVLAPAGVRFEAGPCRARAAVLWLRVEDDRPVRLLALDAESVELRGQRVHGSARPENHFWSAQPSAAVPDIVEERLHVRHRRDR